MENHRLLQCETWCGRFEYTDGNLNVHKVYEKYFPEACIINISLSGSIRQIIDFWLTWKLNVSQKYLSNYSPPPPLYWARGFRNAPKFVEHLFKRTRWKASRLFRSNVINLASLFAMNRFILFSSFFFLFITVPATKYITVYWMPTHILSNFLLDEVECVRFPVKLDSLLKFFFEPFRKYWLSSRLSFARFSIS